MPSEKGRRGGKKDERRRMPRAEIKVPVRIKKGREPMIDARTENISATGAYCTLDRFVPINTKLDVTLLIPEQREEGRARARRVSCRGIVVRNQPEFAAGRGTGYGMALFFTELAHRDKKEVSRYVLKNLPRRERVAVGGRRLAGGGFDPGRVFETKGKDLKDFSISSANFRVLGEGINISKNGICCQTDRSIPLFREIAVNLVLPPSASDRGSPEALQCSAVVVGCKKIPNANRYDMAAYFVGLSRGQKERLEECIKMIM